MRPNLLLPPRMRLQATSLLPLQPRGSYPRLAALPVFSRGSSFLTLSTSTASSEVRLPFHLLLSRVIPWA